MTDVQIAKFEAPCGLPFGGRDFKQFVGYALVDFGLSGLVAIASL
jgi:hypothetical protein